MLAFINRLGALGEGDPARSRLATESAGDHFRVTRVVDAVARRLAEARVSISALLLTERLAREIFDRRRWGA